MSKKKNQEQEGQDILNHIRKDADGALRGIYRQYRKPFLNWSSKYFNLDESTACDVFQEVIIAFYKNVMSLKLQTLDASLQTYLFAIAKNILRKSHRQKQKEKVSLLDDFSNLNLKEWDLDTSALEQQSKDEENVVVALEQLKEKCRDLLKMFYFENASHQEIMTKLGYNSLEVSRSMKRKCIKSLKKIMLAGT